MISRNKIASALRVVGVLLLAFALFQASRPGGFHPLDKTLHLRRRVGLMEAVLDKAHRLATPGLHLEHTDEPRFSWIGGLPTVALGFEWPTWQGQPLTFLAQIDLEEVAAGMKQPWLPKQGQLYSSSARAKEPVFGYDVRKGGPGGSSMQTPTARRSSQRRCQRVWKRSPTSKNKHPVSPHRHAA